MVNWQDLTEKVVAEGSLASVRSPSKGEARPQTLGWKTSGLLTKRRGFHEK